MASKNLLLKLVISAKDTASGALRKLERGLEGIGKKARRAAAGLAKLTAGVIAVGSAAAGWVLGKFIGQSVEAAEALDVQMRTLEATIKATGGAAGLTADEIDEMARRLDEATLGSAQEFRAGANVLLTFKQVGRDAFETVLRLAKDMEAVGLGSFEQNVLQLGKALEDPVKGLSSLTRSGVTFNAVQQEIIKSLVKTGQAAKAQGLILQALAGQFGGAAEAAGGGLTGLKDLAAKLLEDIRETLGDPLLAPLSRIHERVNALWTRLRDSGVATRFGQALGEAWELAAGKVLDFVETVDFDGLATKFRNLAGQAGEAVAALKERIVSAGEITESVVAFMVRHLAGVKAAWLAVYQSVELVFSGLNWAAAQVVGAYATVMEAAAAAGIASEETALKARAASEKLNKSAVELKGSSIGHYNEMIEAGKVFLGIQDEVAKATGNAVTAEERLRQAQSESARFVSDLTEDLRKAGVLIEDNATKSDKAAKNLDVLAQSYRNVGDAAQDAAQSGRDAADSTGVDERRPDAGAPPDYGDGRLDQRGWNNAKEARYQQLTKALRAYDRRDIDANELGLRTGYGDLGRGFAGSPGTDYPKPAYSGAAVAVNVDVNAIREQIEAEFRGRPVEIQVTLVETPGAGDVDAIEAAASASGGRA